MGNSRSGKASNILAHGPFRRAYFEESEDEDGNFTTTRVAVYRT